MVEHTSVIQPGSMEWVNNLIHNKKTVDLAWVLPGDKIACVAHGRKLYSRQADLQADLDCDLNTWLQNCTRTESPLVMKKYSEYLLRASIDAQFLIGLIKHATVWH